MDVDEVAKNLLKNKTCQNCIYRAKDNQLKRDKCIVFYKSSPLPNDNTCAQWKEYCLQYGLNDLVLKQFFEVENG